MKKKTASGQLKDFLLSTRLFYTKNNHSFSIQMTGNIKHVPLIETDAGLGTKWIYNIGKPKIKYSGASSNRHQASLSHSIYVHDCLEIPPMAKEFNKNLLNEQNLCISIGKNVLIDTSNETGMKNDKDKIELLDKVHSHVNLHLQDISNEIYSIDHRIVESIFNDLINNESQYEYNLNSKQTKMSYAFNDNGVDISYVVACCSPKTKKKMDSVNSEQLKEKTYNDCCDYEVRANIKINYNKNTKNMYFEYSASYNPIDLEPNIGFMPLYLASKFFNWTISNMRAAATYVYDRFFRKETKTLKKEHKPDSNHPSSNSSISSLDSDESSEELNNNLEITNSKEFQELFEAAVANLNARMDYLEYILDNIGNFEKADELHNIAKRQLVDIKADYDKLVEISNNNSLNKVDKLREKIKNSILHELDYRDIQLDAHAILPGKILPTVLERQKLQKKCADKVTNLKRVMKNS